MSLHIAIPASLVWPVFRRTTLILAGCGALLLGIGLAYNGQVVARGWIVVSLAVLLLTIRKSGLLALLCVMLLSFALGGWRGTIYLQKLAAYQSVYAHQETVTVRAMDDAVYGSRSQLTFDANDIQLADGRRLIGKLALSGFGPGAVYQGDIIRASGKLYPAQGSYQARMSFAKLHVVREQPSWIAQLRRQFAAGMQSALPEPLAPFAMGLLIGQRATLPANVKQDLLMVGLTHIIAVSGYNLTIMLQASRRLLGNYSKRLSTGLTFGLLIFFLLLAGASASIVRAAIVSTLSILASYYGRSFRPLGLICLAAAVTAWANPLYLWGDASWYLSFLAFFGVLVIAPALDDRLPKRWGKVLPVAVALESLSAEAVTLPFVLHTFGQMSFIGLPANVLVVTLVPLAMLLSLIAGLAGMLAGALAGWVAWPAKILLTYMLDTARLFATVPHVFVQHLQCTTGQMLGMYGIVLGVAWLLQKRTKTRQRVDDMLK